MRLAIHTSGMSWIDMMTFFAQRPICKVRRTCDRGNHPENVDRNETRRACTRSEHAAERHRHRRYFSRHVHGLFLILAPTVLLHLLRPVKYGKNDVALSASRNSITPVLQPLGFQIVSLLSFPLVTILLLIRRFPSPRALNSNYRDTYLVKVWR